MFKELKCKKCGKTINSIKLLYSINWLCSNCTEDKQSVLYCEKGCKVKAIHLDYGMESDVEQATKFLKQDGIYEVELVVVGGCMSEIYLKEFPNEKFNTVHFIRIGDIN